MNENAIIGAYLMDGSMGKHLLHYQRHSKTP